MQPSSREVLLFMYKGFLKRRPDAIREHQATFGFLQKKPDLNTPYLSKSDRICSIKLQRLLKLQKIISLAAL